MPGRRPAARVVVWLAVVMGAAAVTCLAAGLLLLPAASRSPSGGSPAPLAVLLLVAIAVLAGLLCVGLLLGLAVTRGVARLRQPGRPGGPGGPAPR